MCPEGGKLEMFGKESWWLPGAWRMGWDGPKWGRVLTPVSLLWGGGGRESVEAYLPNGKVLSPPSGCEGRKEQSDAGAWSSEGRRLLFFFLVCMWRIVRRSDSQMFTPGLFGEWGIMSRIELSGQRNKFKNIKENLSVSLKLVELEGQVDLQREDMRVLKKADARPELRETLETVLLGWGPPLLIPCSSGFPYRVRNQINLPLSSGSGQRHIQGESSGGNVPMLTWNPSACI